MTSELSSSLSLVLSPAPKLTMKTHSVLQLVRGTIWPDACSQTGSPPFSPCKIRVRQTLLRREEDEMPPSSSHPTHIGPPQ